MKAVVALFVVAAFTVPVLAQPKGGTCPTAQAETVHLYLKANGTDSKADAAGGSTDASASGAASGAHGGTAGGHGAAGGGAGMAIDELGMPVDKKDKKGKGIVTAPAGSASAAGGAPACAAASR